MGDDDAEPEEKMGDSTTEATEVTWAQRGAESARGLNRSTWRTMTPLEETRREVRREASILFN